MRKKKTPQNREGETDLEAGEEDAIARRPPQRIDCLNFLP